MATNTGAARAYPHRPVGAPPVNQMRTAAGEVTAVNQGIRQQWIAEAYAPAWRGEDLTIFQLRPAN